MEDYKKEFIEFMIDCEVLKFGDFVTKSGRKTPFFVNTGFYRTGAQLRRLGQYYARAIKETFGTDFNVLFGPAYKGIPLTVAATMSISEMYDADIRYCSNRKEVKDHGAGGNPIRTSGGGDYGTAGKAVSRRFVRCWSIATKAEAAQRKREPLQTGGVTRDRENEVFKYHRSEG